MLLYVAIGIERTVLPFLANKDCCNSVIIIHLLYLFNLIIGDSSAIPGNKIIEPFMVHRLMGWEAVEHGIQHGIEIGCHVVSRTLQEFMIGDELAEFSRTLLELFLPTLACCHHHGSRKDKK